MRRPVVVRTDSAGCTEGFVWGCRTCNIGFAVVARSNAQIHGAISRIVDDESRRSPARRQDGDEHEGAQVAEVTDLVDLAGWPEGTRLIVRREPLHPDAQQTLFPSLQHRYWGHYTDQPGDPVERDVFMRAPAHVEDHIGRLKRHRAVPVAAHRLGRQRRRFAVVCFIDALVRWFQQLCLTGPLAAPNPNGCAGSSGTPARLVHRGRHRVVRILDDWPTTDQLLGAYRHLTLIT